MNILQGEIAQNESLNSFLSVCQIASLFHMNREFRQVCQLRVNILSECAQSDVRSTVAEKMLNVLKTCRIDAVVNVIALAEDERVQHAIHDAETHTQPHASQDVPLVASPSASSADAAVTIPASTPAASEDSKWLDDIFGTGSIVQSVSKVNAKVINLMDTLSIAQELQPLASSVVTSHDQISSGVEMSSISREKFRDGFNRLDARSKYHITSEIIKQHSHATIAVFLLAIEQVQPRPSQSICRAPLYALVPKSNLAVEQPGGCPTLASSLELIGNISLLEVALSSSVIFFVCCFCVQRSVAAGATASLPRISRLRTERRCQSRR